MTPPKARVLIVDDSSSMRSSMALILRRKGYEVTTAASGQEAISLARSQPFDVLFLDIKMPLMNGVETYRAIKRLHPRAAAIMMTGYAVEDLVRQAAEEGAYAILEKPMSFDRVVPLIDEAVHSQLGALVLVVDDDPGTCTTFRRILERQGYRVGVAHTGEDAIQMAKEDSYDVYVIDMKLPTINGLETHLALKAIRPQAVTVLITGYRQEMSELVEDALRHDAYACLTKPLDMSRVLALLQEVEGRRT